MPNPIQDNLFIKSLELLADSLQPTIDSVKQGLGMEVEEQPVAAIDSNQALNFVDKLGLALLTAQNSALVPNKLLAKMRIAQPSFNNKLKQNILLHQLLTSLNLYLENGKMPNLSEVRTQMMMDTLERAGLGLGTLLSRSAPVCEEKPQDLVCE